MLCAYINYNFVYFNIDIQITRMYNKNQIESLITLNLKFNNINKL